MGVPINWITLLYMQYQIVINKTGYVGEKRSKGNSIFFPREGKYCRKQEFPD
jgi:hypothetical protein